MTPTGPRTPGPYVSAVPSPPGVTREIDRTENVHVILRPAVMLPGGIRRFPWGRSSLALGSLTVTSDDLTFTTALRRVRRFTRADVDAVEYGEWPGAAGGRAIVKIVLVGGVRPSWWFKPGAPALTRQTLGEFGWPVVDIGWDGGRPLWGR